MDKKRYVMATASISTIAGLIAIVLFSRLGFSIAKVADPSLYANALARSPLVLILSLALMGVSLGALFAGARFLGKLQATGVSAMAMLIAALVGSVVFWNHITSYTLLALGAVAGASIGGLFASGARGTRFGIGFDQAKKAVVTIAIVALVGTMLVVSGNTEYYRDQFMSSITGMAAVSTSSINNATIEQMVRNANPQMGWDDFLTQAGVTDYGALTPEQQQTLQQMYHNYTIEYEGAVAKAVAATRENLANSTNASATILNSLSFFRLILDNIALFYAISLAAIVMLAGSIVIEPVAGLTSWAFQKPLPEKLQPKPKDEMLDVAWASEQPLLEHKE